MGCAQCFHPGSGLLLSTVDVPQPRWVGPDYGESAPRILIVMLNPGAGGESQRPLQSLLHRFRGRDVDFAAVLDFQRDHMRAWGQQGRFLPFYTTSLGLELDRLSFLNIALCATEGNKYPPTMLNRCFNAHTAEIARELQPDIVLLSGSVAHSFASAFAHQLPNARIVPMLHYAHREGMEVENRELHRIRQILSESATRTEAASSPQPDTNDNHPSPEISASHACQQLIEAAKYLESVGMSGQQLTQLHHFSLTGRMVTFKEAYRYFGTKKDLGEKNANYAARLSFMADCHKRGRHNIDVLIQEAIARWPL